MPEEKEDGQTGHANRKGPALQRGPFFLATDPYGLDVINNILEDIADGRTEQSKNGDNDNSNQNKN